MKLCELLGAVGCDAPRKDVEITDVTADSRKAGKGTLFVSLLGSAKDGNDFIDEAVRRGAVAVVTDRETANTNVPVIVVDDARRKLSQLCAVYYCGNICAECETSLVAVTGTNGKTTTAHMIAHILSSAGYKTGIVGTVGSGLYSRSHSTYGGMTTPDPESFYRELGEMRSSGAEYIVIEASSHGIAQERLAGLSYTGCVPRMAIFTNLSAEHMDFHPTMGDYFRVKSRLFSDFGFEKRIINTDDEYGRMLHSNFGGISVGCGDGAECRAENVIFDGEHGIRYVYDSPSAVMNVRCPVPGTYTVYNSLLAVSAALSLGVEATAVADAMSVFGGVCGRMERVHVDERKFAQPVYIDFAHTPAALEAQLLSMRKVFPNKRLVTLFGCGGDRDKTKRAVMGRIASRLSDYTVVTADNSRSERTEDIISDIMTGIIPSSAYSVIKNRSEAIEYVIMNAQDNDVILLAGKGHEDYDDTGGVKLYFDEREAVRLAIEKRCKLK